ncbi:zinc finger protein 106 [Oreochromis aureus]|uniref:C2H2-type domain-containing protein n=1 Tax=Oreochromis aureus TaxID=47969 RepID=A0A668RN71_OREAU|nr:zinc finger protein 106 [Oreochromis aureus]XP_039459560.1 zinc finger protein 106 [Oreochromis aureus]
MTRDRKCILCETVYVSKQEMDEHMRSMLHHRELENLKGRDCGHECRVCKVKVVSLTDYASHISSPTHKQNVEAADQKPAGLDHEEDYFDQELVDLIEKRKEKIRKEKEAAAAKLAKEEEDKRRKEAFQQRLKEAKERYCLQRGWQQPGQGFGGSSHHRTWYRSNQFDSRAGETQPWNQGKQGKSATWHAQEPPNLEKWASGEFAGRSSDSQEARSNKTWGHCAFPGKNENRFPWLSNGGSRNGLYGQNNISQYTQKNRQMSFLGVPRMYPPPPVSLAQAVNKFQNTGNDQPGQASAGLQKGDGQPAESDINSSKSSKTLGSNPKIDKSCRWSPYPVKGFESVPHKDTGPKSSEEYPRVPKPQNTSFNSQSRSEKESSLLPLSRLEEKGRHKTNPAVKPRDGSSSSSRSSSSQRDGHQNSASNLSNQNANKSLLDRKMSSAPGISSVAHLSKIPSQAQVQSKPTGIQSEVKAPLTGSFQSRQQQKLPESVKHAKQTVLEKKGSLNTFGNNVKVEMTWHSVEEPQTNQVQSQTGVKKEISCRQNAAKSVLPDPVGSETLALTSSDTSQFLQSLQVSTSTVETSKLAEAGREYEENSKKVEKQSCSVVPDETMQATEAGQSSESDTSRSGDAQTHASSLSKLDLPPVLKRDLTKHISSKSKTVGHEPNLNIARRVRNVSESRRSDTEKDSGLKPTVWQLISSSGSRRNVNWEQVYHEVRKKQDKGKGMPRFGIEMVSYEQEYQSQEEGDIPLLEGFQWESLMDVSYQGPSRKRSLSESSLAPASTHNLFTSHISKETSQRESFNSEQQGSSVNPNRKSSLGTQDSQSQPEVGQMLVQLEAKALNQTDNLTSALQRSDSVLGDSSSGTEQCDGLGTGKRRRAAGDALSTESSCIEHNSKRQKVKSKRERSHIDQLLAVSLREDELSRSLQTVDTSLIQARAALEAAYMEVQRLMVVKQQMTVEMSTLRNKRIELLKGMQGTMEEAPQIKLKEEKMDTFETEAHVPSSVTLSSLVETAVHSPNRAAECGSPPSSSLPLMSVAIKQEPLSPVHISSEPDLADALTNCAHSTTPELPVTPARASSPDFAVNFQASPERHPELYPSNFTEPADSKEKSLTLIETTEKAIQTTRSSLTSLADTKSPLKSLLPIRDCEVNDSADIPSFKSPLAPSVLNIPASLSELRTGKRVRKLKKRKALKKAQGTEQFESSDTEMDEEASRPRCPRTRRRPSGGSQVSTSSLPTEDREGDMNTEGDKKPLKMLFPSAKLEKAEQKSPAELPHEATADIMVNLDSEESMEVSVAGQQPQVDVQVQTPPPAPIADSSRPEPQSLACNEVSSTSDMDLCKSSESDMPFAITLPKNSSDASSDHGEDEMPTDGLFEGHQEAVNAMQIHNGLLYTCSGDRTVKAFDLVSHKCVGTFEGHSSKVSCLLVSAAPSLHHRLYSGSSDQIIRCYSLRTRELEQQFSLSDRVLCLHSRWKTLYAGLANGTVVTFNLKTNKQMDVFECHGPRAVSCLASSQEGARRILLVGSYDSTISVRDAKNGLLLRTLEGHTKTVLCMKVVNDLVFSGSSDQCVYAHNIHTGELVRVYKGHSHAVTVVAILGKVMVTACLDKLVRVYDLQSHDQLQVYGGHKDMVMCMAIHKNMIYTGCYDGSVQAVKLNLMQNYRCWWHGCSLVFGLIEHLQQHLINDHTSANFQTLKCRWKNCEVFFSARNTSKQGMLMHMQKHAEEDTEVEP